MSLTPTLKPIRLALLAGAFGTLLMAPAAMAQDNGRYDDAAYSSDNETVTVTAPHFRVERSMPGGLPEKVSLSRAVPYDDLDLTQPADVRTLKDRVRAEARDICSQLADAVPTPQAPGTSCFRSAYEDALLRVNAAVREARADY